MFTPKSIFFQVFDSLSAIHYIDLISLYNTAGNIFVLRNFKFLDKSQENKMFWTEYHEFTDISPLFVPLRIKF